METGRWELVQEDVFVVFKVVRDGEGNVLAESLVFLLSSLVFFFFKHLDSLFITMLCSLNAHIRLLK